MRRIWELLPLLNFMFVVLLSALTARFYYMQELEDSQIKAQNLSEQLSTSLEIFSADRLRALHTLSNSWPVALSNPNDWFNVKAKELAKMLPGFENLLFTDAAGIIQWSIRQHHPQLLKGQALAILLPTQTVAEPLYQTIRLNQKYFVAVALPLLRDNHPHGKVVAIIDIRGMLLTLTNDLQYQHLAVEFSDRQQTVFSLNHLLPAQPYADQTVRFFNNEFRLRVQSDLVSVTGAIFIFLFGSALATVFSLALSNWLNRELYVKDIQSLYQSAADASLDGVLLFVKSTFGSKHKFVLFSCNAMARHYFSPLKLIESYTSVRVVCHKLGQPDLEQQLHKVYWHKVPYQALLRTKGKDFNGDWFKLQMVRTERGVALTLHDVTVEQNLQERIQYQATHDALTGLLNRLAFSEELESSVRTGEKACLCFIDLDKFKAVNDSCGHQAGDELLIQVAALLQSCLAKEDSLARVGGDEFCIIIRNLPLNLVCKKLDLVLAKLAGFEFCFEQQVFHIGASIGVMELNRSTVSAVEAMKAADAGCYVAKNSGRNQYYVVNDHNPAWSQMGHERAVLALLQQALQQNLFQLWAQPIFSLDGQTAFQIEILLRLQPEQGPLMTPGDFIPVAERQGLMPSIDQWVIQHVLLELEKHPEYQKNLHKCAVNISAISLCDPQFLDWLDTALAQTSVAGHRLCFEITETAAISNLKQAQHFIKVIKAYGCTFSLDDFGVGMASFGSLKALNVDYVKIDGTFISHLKAESSDAVVVQAIANVAQSMKRKVIAEYVLDPQSCELLQQLGVEYGQGFGLAKPASWLSFADQKSTFAVDTEQMPC